MIPKVKYYGPRIPSTYAVNMTAAASGSNGITVADDDDIDFGTGDFFLHWEGSLPDWTPNAGAQDLINKLSASVGYRLVIGSTALGFPIVVLNATSYAASIANTLVNGAIAKITACIVRETASSAGSVTFYINGVQHGTAVAISSGAPATISNAVSAYASGTSTARTASNAISCIVGNFAPTASEVLDLCTNGIPASWKWGSQTATYTSNFSAGVDSFTASNGSVSGNWDAIGGENDWLKFDINANLSTHRITRAGAFTAGFKYRVSGKLYIPSTNSHMNGVSIGDSVLSSAALSLSSPALDTVVPWSAVFTPSGTEFRITGLDDGQATFQDAGGDDVFYVKDIVFTRVGATMALLPDTIPTSSATTWSDTSGNTGGGTLPAAGATKVTIRR